MDDLKDIQKTIINKDDSVLKAKILKDLEEKMSKSVKK